MYNNHSHYQIRIENKVGKKLHQLLTWCVTGVTFINLIFYSYLIIFLLKSLKKTVDYQNKNTENLK